MAFLPMAYDAKANWLAVQPKANIPELSSAMRFERSSMALSEFATDPI